MSAGIAPTMLCWSRRPCCCWDGRNTPVVVHGAGGGDVVVMLAPSRCRAIPMLRRRSGSLSNRCVVANRTRYVGGEAQKKQLNCVPERSHTLAASHERNHCLWTPIQLMSPVRATFIMHRPGKARQTAVNQKKPNRVFPENQASSVVNRDTNTSIFELHFRQA